MHDWTECCFLNTSVTGLSVVLTDFHLCIRRQLASSLCLGCLSRSVCVQDHIEVCEHDILQTACGNEIAPHLQFTSNLSTQRAVDGDRDELIRFWGKKGQSHDENKCDKKIHSFKNAPLQQRHTGLQFAVEDHLVYYWFWLSIPDDNGLSSTTSAQPRSTAVLFTSYQIITR